jgi:hypothetical protein
MTDPAKRIPAQTRGGSSQEPSRKSPPRREADAKVKGAPKEDAGCGCGPESKQASEQARRN